MDLVLSLQMMETNVGAGDTAVPSSGTSSNSNTCSSASTGGCSITKMLF